MALEIFKLVGSVMVDTNEANKSLAKTDEHAEKAGNSLLKAAEKAAKWAAGLVAAAGAVGGAMIASARATASNLDEIDKASQRMEMDAESYQKLAYAADLCGVNGNGKNINLRINNDKESSFCSIIVDKYEISDGKKYTLLGEYASIEDVLFSTVIDNTPFSSIITDNTTELISQD